MEYPVWHFSGINTGLFIAIVAVLHVFVAQFAVGGGLYLVWMERKAHREKSPELLRWIEGHTRFFLLLTMVFGGLSGVGIWLTISMVNPGATVMLIHNFVFIWAAEWVFFLLEVVSLLIYQYSFPMVLDGRMDPRTHMRIGVVYAVSGYMSLVLINGVVAFMLTPGEGLQSGNLWDGFFNPTYFPSLVLRTGICLVLAGMFALFTANRIASPTIRRMAVRQSGLWVAMPFLLLLAGSAWHFMALPPDRLAAIMRRTADIHPFFVAYGWILPAVFLSGILAFVLAERLRRPLSVVILCVGLILVGSYEWVRETGRRPWTAEGYMYSNGMTLSQETQANEEGIASVSGWLWTLAAHESGKRPLAQAPAEGLSAGALIFSLQCATCHGRGGPRIDIIPRIERLTRAGLDAQLRGSGKRLDYMPPFAGSDDDRNTLVDFLDSLRRQSKNTPSPEAP